MPRDVIALTIGNASIPLYAEDWPSVKCAVEDALVGKVGHANCVNGKEERIQTVRYTVADKSILATAI